jgi:hypothetical protein
MEDENEEIRKLDEMNSGENNHIPEGND